MELGVDGSGASDMSSSASSNLAASSEDAEGVAKGVDGGPRNELRVWVDTAGEGGAEPVDSVTEFRTDIDWS